ncbi:MAG: DUF2569 domain-containing protein [Pseudomonadales bacterium]|nr:DUF2569 domain-containing protein [Pseudomonadales bacterium]
MSEEKDLNGLRGWLILVGIGLVYSPIRLVSTYYPLFSEVFSDGTWEILTTQGTEAYHPLWGPLLMSELIFNGGMVLLCFYLIYLFFTRHRLFPKVYIFMILISFLILPFDAWMVTFVLPDEPMFDPETVKELISAAVSVVIWVPYMLRSKRVKATFVEPVPDSASQPIVESSD